MENSNLDLLEKITRLESELKEAKHNIEILTDYVLRLSVCKQVNPKYPYYDFIVSYGIDPYKQSKIDLLFSLMSEKLESNKIPERFGNIEDFPTDFLFRHSPLKYEDVEEAIMNILNAKSSDVPITLIQSMKDQGLQVKLCEHLLSIAN
ncbi:hypothetical protein [Caldalkalibacillus salinus]|uniref:hypothetical protein n=1 Tax=Caldalkalibacillus salinus TaxID=2803787 RepID=UPI0019248995|nr:hypothetical protein [Caldalkalibacillus salinus]